MKGVNLLRSHSWRIEAGKGQHEGAELSLSFWVQWEQMTHFGEVLGFPLDHQSFEVS